MTPIIYITTLLSSLTSPIVIGIAGPAASGKSTLSQSIKQSLERTPTSGSECSESEFLRVTVIAMDSFIVAKTQLDYEIVVDLENDIQYNRVVPTKRIDWSKLETCVKRLKRDATIISYDAPVTIPLFNFSTWSRVVPLPLTQAYHTAEQVAALKQKKPVGTYSGGDIVTERPHVVIVEGPMIFSVNYPPLQELFDVKIFVDCDDSVTLERRLERNVMQRGMDEQKVRKVHDLLRHYFNPYIRRESSRALSDPEDNLITIDFSKDVTERSEGARNAIVKFVEGCRSKMANTGSDVLPSEREQIFGEERATLVEELKSLL